MKFLVILLLALTLLYLVRRRLIYVDLTFPWFVALCLLGLASISEPFVATLAAALQIQLEPLAVVFGAIFILLAIITSMLISMTALRRKQIQIVRHIIAGELDGQAARLAAAERI